MLIAINKYSSLFAFSLIFFSLQSNQIGDAGAQAIAAAITGNNTLTELGYVLLIPALKKA